MTEEIRQGRIEANGLEFAFLEAGEGPLVLVLHGFPDNAWTWRHQLEHLAATGYRVVAPFMRGYPPTEVPTEPFDLEDTTNDVRALIDALAGEPSVVVGHDWGALAALDVAAAFPDVVTTAVSIGVGHPATAIEIFKHPSQLHYAFHVWLFQLDGFAEFALRDNDFALVDYLWQHWSHQPVDDAHVKEVKNAFGEPGAVEAALSYYRGLIRIPTEKPEFFQLVTGPISVPTLIMYGSEDPAQIVSAGEAPNFTGRYRREIVEGAGHFAHLEQPERVNALLDDWFQSDATG